VETVPILADSDTRAAGKRSLLIDTGIDGLRGQPKVGPTALSPWRAAHRLDRTGWDANSRRSTGSKAPEFLDEDALQHAA